MQGCDCVMQSSDVRLLDADSYDQMMWLASRQCLKFVVIGKFSVAIKKIIGFVFVLFFCVSILIFKIILVRDLVVKEKRRINYAKPI